MTSTSYNRQLRERKKSVKKSLKKERYISFSPALEINYGVFGR